MKPINSDLLILPLRELLQPQTVDWVGPSAAFMQVSPIPTYFLVAKTIYVLHYFAYSKNHCNFILQELGPSGPSAYHFTLDRKMLIFVVVLSSRMAPYSFPYACQKNFRCDVIIKHHEIRFHVGMMRLTSRLLVLNPRMAPPGHPSVKWLAKWRRPVPKILPTHRRDLGCGELLLEV